MQVRLMDLPIELLAVIAAQLEGGDRQALLGLKHARLTDVLPMHAAGQVQPGNHAQLPAANTQLDALQGLLLEQQQGALPPLLPGGAQAHRV